MAIVKIMLKCSTCGREFQHRHECRNSKDANSYEEWALHNVDECPDCRRERLRQEAIAVQKAKAEETLRQLQALGVSLPEITGTEKQIAYADDLRLRVLARDKRYPILVAVLQRHAAGDHAGLRALYKDKSAIDAELDRYAQLVKDKAPDHLALIALCGDARQLINALR